MEKRQRQFSIWYFLLAFLALLAIENYFFSSHVETLPYSEFKQLLKAGKVTDLTLEEHAISGALKKEGLEGILPRKRSRSSKSLERESTAL